MWRKLYERLREKLWKRYRIELIDDVTMRQSRYLVLKPITVVGAVALLVLGIVLSTAAFVLLTPAFHRLIPGYQDPKKFEAERVEMAQQLTNMEQQIERWSFYIESLRKLAGVTDSLPEFSQDRLDAYRREQTAGTGEELPAAPPLPVPAPAPAGSGLPLVRVSRQMPELLSPLEGKVRRGFEPQAGHYGVDIAAPEGSLIRAAAGGYVIVSEYSEANGWVLGIAAPNDLLIFYKHNQRLLKPVGSYAAAGEPVAVIGNTGENSTGPHLHLELWRQGRPVNPADFITFGL
jgi:murein DD-endopeptidase MepM/ murein hydrolase activator NlpD